MLNYVKVGKYTASAVSENSTYFWTVELAKAYQKLEIISVIKTNLNGLFKTKYLETEHVMILCKANNLIRSGIFHSDSCS